jgi:hypothetical protein
MARREITLDPSAEQQIVGSAGFRLGAAVFSRGRRAASG